MNMVSAMSWRIYLSGELPALDKKSLSIIHEGVDLYKSMLYKFVKNGLPYWPLGMAQYGCQESAFALKFGTQILLSVWNFRNDVYEIIIPVKKNKIKQIFPASYQVKFSAETMTKITMPAKSARIFLMED